MPAAFSSRGTCAPPLIEIEISGRARVNSALAYTRCAEYKNREIRVEGRLGTSVAGNNADVLIYRRALYSGVMHERVAYADVSSI